jgi:hypothetical protein
MSEQQTKPQEAGFRLRGHFYPSVTNELLTDAPLIELVCGITSHEWRSRYIDELEKTLEAQEAGKTLENPDEIVSLGSIAIAISREHPSWSRSKVAAFIEGLDWEELEAVNPVEEETKQIPLADGTPGETSTSQSSETSNSGSEPPSETSEIPQTSGLSTSPT